MIGDLGVPELLIIGALLVLLFGVGKLGRLGKDLGTSVKEFRRAMTDEDAARPIVAAPEYSATVEAPAASTAAPATSTAERQTAGPSIF